MNKLITRKSAGIFSVLLLAILFSLAACKSFNAVTSTTYFFDNAIFSQFTDQKVEEFVVKNDIMAHFTMRGEVESGEIYVKVYNKDNDEILFEKSGVAYDSEFDIELTAGTYCYVLNIKDCTNGSVYNKAEAK